MDPAGAGRVRGFRAPTAAEAARDAVPPPAPETVETQAPSERRQGAAWRWLLLAGGVLLVAIAVIGVLAFRLGTSSAASAASASASASPTPRRTPTPLPVTDLYTQVVPSVVLVTTAKGSLGSGTVVTDTGTILTANHVVADGSKVSVLFADGTRSAASVASADPKTDTATLKPSTLPEVVVPAVLGGAVAVGSDVVAMGNPLGLRDSTTTGVVSGLGRTSRTQTGSIGGLIQFDAAVNPGSSGGPLLDGHGAVVGVVVSIADPGKDDAFAGIGFAVPIGAALGGGGDGPGQGGGPQK